MLDVISILIGRGGFPIGMHEHNNHSSSVLACELWVTGDGCVLGEKIDVSGHTRWLCGEKIDSSTTSSYEIVT